MKRQLFMAAVGVVLAGTLPGTAHGDPVVTALDAAARPLDRLADTVDGAVVVGVGEATHGQHELFEVQHDLFRELAHRKRFGTFAREVSWSAGLRIDEYVVHGTGDLRQIMREEFQGDYLWNTEEHLALIEWMRDYNQTHRDPIRFMGDDMVYAGADLYDRVHAYAAKARPWLIADLDRLYAGMAPTTGFAEWTRTYPAVPADVRRANRDRALQAVDLLHANGSDPWVVQHARVIAQSMTMWAGDFTNPEEAAAGFRYREQAMAENILWWRQHTGDRMVLAGHDGHVATTSYWDNYPQVQGTYLREHLGDGYLAIGTTFHHGEFTLYDGQARRVAVGPPSEGGNESTLDQVRRRDFFVDTRTAPAAARRWLAVARPTRQYAESYPAADKQIALGRSFDVVVHVSRTTASRLLP
jgi:erythromycin esterase